MSKIADKELEQKIHDYFASQEDEIPPVDPVRLEHLKRMAARNAKDYNPQTDEMLIPDLMEIIRIRIKPVVLTDDQKSIISEQFNDCKTMKNVYKVLDRIVEYLNLAFFNYKPIKF